MEPLAEETSEERPDVTAEPSEPPAGTASEPPDPPAPRDPSPAEPRDPDVALDDEAPAEIEKTFTVLCALGGAMCLVPRQWWSAGLLFALAGVGLILVMRRRRQGTRA